MYSLTMRWFLFFIFFMSKTLIAEDKNTLEDFANKYLETFQDKLSYKSFKLVLDVKDSEILIEKKYGSFKYKFNEYQIDEGEMVIEKGFDNISFKLLHNSGKPLFSLSYKANFN